mmetsp:Transcript_50960/g.121939  ORF Transcript_50960/g.121939 Transcript_50960/m.121939 type:complete len:228 (+) Transcript_50960:136-819(+)
MGRQDPSRCGVGVLLYTVPLRRSRPDFPKDTSEATKEPRLSVSSAVDAGLCSSARDASRSSAVSWSRHRTAIITTLDSMNPAPSSFRGVGASLKIVVCAMYPEIILEDVKTVALTAAGHLVAPAAGSTIENTHHMVRIARSPKACHGSSWIVWRASCAEELRPKSGGTKANSTANNRETIVSTETGMSFDFLAQTNAPAWKHPDSKAMQYPRGDCSVCSEAPNMNCG